MDHAIYHIPVPNLLIALALVFVVILIYARWSLEAKTLIYATVRMLLQLTLIGFALTFVFQTKNQIVICLILSLMLLVGSWIALRPVASHRRQLLPKAFFALFVGSVSTLIVVVIGVVRLHPWYEPRYLIPLAGMIFANSMNTLSLAAERFQSETNNRAPYEKARATAFQTALLPLVNSFFAVGLVSLPGMMTGQILAGISPLIAVRYQVVVMCMLLGASGISTAIYLVTLRKPAIR